MSELGKVGAWLLADVFSAADNARIARKLESWGYRTLWIPEAFGCNPMVQAAWILSQTERLTLATGIANIYARDPLATVNALHGLNEMSGGRFLLGLGVSHAPLVEGMRGQAYKASLAAMRDYLERMQATQYAGVAPPARPRTVLGALGPKMLELSASHADGAHPYNVTPEHTARAREILGPGKLLLPEQIVLRQTDPAQARATARGFLAGYLRFPNYTQNFLRLGFTEDDLAGGGSDRLVDSIVCWGDEAQFRARIQAHLDAGADQVAIQILPRQGRVLAAEDLALFKTLAPATRS
ncbi:TIGR03620 family F420-dependent LLM class oxidoreductase [Novosphingobium sp. JCM 18896]|uniref:TIGR03620 family F420-dependent LLM class oxidoreductase n=1 Tax=Novosphingobium sp. JCM 18896 TaxID=2989731 RepID=UPI00222203F8|nr:TIGR03620 family F420-dependent LLM class oxidoreductase [Novosphingobium sp. JCM 18896]MCW1429692.1 TIGR03620 family F420-dependent LLM class oxidoreductase [Novosphingobium sp. JCM 18896]